jgi:lipid-binding SYLF domain-containing protein
MTRLLRILLVVSLALAAMTQGQALAHDRVAGTLWSASEVLDTLQALPERCIPPALMHDAQGVAIIPHVVKVGFAVGGRFGQGLVLGRCPDGSWGNPVFINLTGGSFGWQIGVESTDVVLVFKTKESYKRLVEGKSKITLGADVSVAAGPVGRQAGAGTDAKLRAEIFSYSRSRGLFLGVSLEGAAITQNGRSNAAFAQRPRPEDLMAVGKLKAQLSVMSGSPPPPGVIIGTPPPMAAPAPPPGLPAQPVPVPPGSSPPPGSPPPTGGPK